MCWPKTLTEIVILFNRQLVLDTVAEGAIVRPQVYCFTIR